jgi:putative PIN family toxin of toxin-antitoxin system
VTRVTLDSNVYLSGFVFGGKPKRVLEMAIDGEIEVAVSDPIIQEVRRHLLGKFGWSEPRAAEAVQSIAEFAKHVTPTATIDTVPTDPDDNRVLECAVSAGSQTIVSGDDDLLRLVAFRGIEIVRVADFLTRFSAGDR